MPKALKAGDKTGQKNRTNNREKKEKKRLQSLNRSNPKMFRVLISEQRHVAVTKAEGTLQEVLIELDRKAMFIAH